MKITDKQADYLLFLLQKNGYSTKWMNAEYKKLGASMRERSGAVQDWIASLDVARASELIDRLK